MVQRRDRMKGNKGIRLSCLFGETICNSIMPSGKIICVGFNFFEYRRGSKFTVVVFNSFKVRVMC